MVWMISIYVCVVRVIWVIWAYGIGGMCVVCGAWRLPQDGMYEYSMGDTYVCGMCVVGTSLRRMASASGSVAAVDATLRPEEPTKEASPGLWATVGMRN